MPPTRLRQTMPKTAAASSIADAIVGLDSMLKGRPVMMERCPDTGLYVVWVGNAKGLHAQGETVEEAMSILREVVAEDAEMAR